MPRIGIIDRAIQLATTRHFKLVQDIEEVLRTEGYLDAGSHLSSDLRETVFQTLHGQSAG